MKVLLIGLGSMGKRRLRLIKEYNQDIDIYAVDLKEERRIFCEENFDIKTYSNLDIALEERYDCAFISTSPITHSKIINKCLKNNMNIFTEINLVDDLYDENIKLAEEKNLKLFLSSTFMYRKEIKKIKEYKNKSKFKANYIYHIGQYLKDWHPWESYKDFFVSNKRTNGCREIFAIELPWILDVFGKIKTINALKSNISDLEIDYPDNFIVTIEHENGDKGSLIVDIVSRKAVRNFELYTKDLHLTWNGKPEGLVLYDYENQKDIKIDLYENIEREKGYSNFIIENAYMEEVKTFFEMIKGSNKEVYGFKEDKETLKIIDEIEK